MGHGRRQMVNVDAFGFPRGKPKGIPIHPFRTGDIVRANIPKGKYAGEYEERISSIKTSETRVGFQTKEDKEQSIFRPNSSPRRSLILMVMTINLLQMNSYFKNKIKKI